MLRILAFLFFFIRTPCTRSVAFNALMLMASYLPRWVGRSTYLFTNSVAFGSRLGYVLSM